MRAFGAKVILTPAAERGTGMVRRAEELAKKHGWFLARQFENPANPAYHRKTTGPEILQDFAGQRLDFWVTGWGTGGTLTGAGEVIKARAARSEVIATEPAGASLLGGKEWKPHKIQGWTPDFLPDVLNRELLRRARAGHRRRGQARRARARAQRKASSSASRPAPRSPRPQGRAEGAARATSCWRCCPTPASATCRPPVRRHRRRRRPGALRSPRQQFEQRCAAALLGVAEISLGPPPDSRRCRIPFRSGAAAR